MRSHLSVQEMEDNHDERRRQQRLDAEDQVECFLDILSTRYGVKLEDIPKYLEAIRWAIEHRANMARLIWAVALGIAGIAVTGAVAALWEGIKHAIRS